MLLVQSVSHFYSVSLQCKRLSIQKVQNGFSLCVIFVLTLTDLLSLNHWERERESENLSELLTPSLPSSHYYSVYKHSLCLCVNSKAIHLLFIKDDVCHSVVKFLWNSGSIEPCI